MSVMVRESFVKAGVWKRKLLNNIATLAILSCALVALATLFYIFGYICYRGFPALNWNFFTQLPVPVGETGGGLGNALLGTVTLVGMASLLGIPWGVFTGVYLSEFGRGKLAKLVRFSADMLSSVPSIVVGLFVYAMLVRPMHGFSAVAGAVALAIIMIPTVARTTEELLRLVPTHIREAGLGLGLPRWRVILSIVLKGSLGGITTGVMLGVARVAGETAPLIFTAFYNSGWQRGIGEPIASLPERIFTYAKSPFDEWHRLAWASALVLVVFVLALNLLTRLILRPAPASRE